MTNNSDSEMKLAPRAISLRIEILLLSMLVLCLAQGFITMLGTLSFQKEYRETFISGNRAVAREFPQKVERAIRFGKRIDNFYGIEALMTAIDEKNTSFTNLEIYLPDGTVAYSLDESRTGEKVPETWLKETTVEGPDAEPVLLFPIQNPAGEQVATAAVMLNDSILHEKVKTHLTHELQLTLMVLAAAAVLLIIALRLFVPLQEGGGFPRKRLLAVVIVITLLSQSALISLGTLSMREVFLQVIEEDVGKVIAQLQGDLETLVEKGLPLNNLYNVEEMLHKVMTAAPSVAAMQITDPDHLPLYTVESESPVKVSEHFLGQLLVEQQIELSLPVHRYDDTGKKVVDGFIKASVSGTFLQAHIQEFVLNAMTILLVSLLFITEVLLFFLLFVRHKYALQQLHAEGSGSHDYIRTAMTVFLFGFMMTVSFVPLQMQALVRPGESVLSAELFSSLPISAEMLFGLLAVLLGGIWSDRHGWHQPFLSGVVISAVACWWSGTTSDPWMFVASRGLAGCGYGLTWMAAQGFVFGSAKAAMRARSLASLTAGVMSGYLCGNVVGAMLAERIGFEPVFLVSAVFILMGIPVVLLFMRTQMRRPQLRNPRADAGQGWLLGLRFLFDRKVLFVLICCVIPLAIYQVGMVAYAAPVCLSAMGVSQANIGRAIMLFGLTMVYFGPWVSYYIDGPTRAKQFLVVAGMLGGGGMLLFFQKPDLEGFMLAIVLSGLACCFGLSAQTVVVQSLPVAKDLGSGIAISMERLASKLGQMLGPMLMGALFANMSMAAGLGWIGGGVVALTLVYAMVQLIQRSAQTS